MGRQGTGTKGFSLVEIMMIVLIIGLLAAIAIPAYLNARTRSQATTLANNFRIYAAAFEIYATEEGSFPPDVNRGIIPAGMEGRLPKFTEPSIVGGNWDWDQGSVGFTAAVTLIGSDIEPRVARKIDEILDNGDPASGRLILRNNMVIYVIER